MNFSETFRKNETYDNIKSDQKTMLYSLQTVIFYFFGNIFLGLRHGFLF